MEGRQFDKAGKDLGDAAFHEKAFGLTPEKEKDQLEKQAAMLVDLEEAQAKEIAAKSPQIGARAYDELLSKHPEEPRAEEWRNIKRRLEDEK
jgi:hypothetical protein